VIFVFYFLLKNTGGSNKGKFHKNVKVESLTAKKQAWYPCFSRMSTLKQIMIKNIIAPTYHGIVRRKKPNINLHIAEKLN
jgi:hypothetical protein